VLIRKRNKERKVVLLYTAVIPKHHIAAFLAAFWGKKTT
jgi:hypothetical protein